MKRKPYMLICILTLILLVGTGLVFSGFEAQSQEDQAAYEAMLEALDAQMNGGVIPASDLTKEMSKRNASSDAQLNEAISQAGAQTEEDYGNKLSGDLAEKYQEKHEQLMDVKSLETDVSVGAGILSPNLINVQDVSETEKKLKISYVNWLCAVEPVNGKYEVVLIFNRDTGVMNACLEDGEWKLVNTDGDGYIKEFYPASYDPVAGTFDTFQEAAAFAAAIDVKEKNPF